MLTVALALFLAGPEEAWTREPAAYREVRWGAPLADAGAAIGPGDCLCVPATGEKRQRDGFCGIKPETDPARIPERRFCERPAEIGATQVAEKWTFRSDRLSEIGWTFPASLYPALRDVLVEKYGPPTDTATDEIQSNSGVKATNETLTWKGSTVTVSISRFGDKITQGRAAFELTADVQARLRAFLEKQRAGVKSF